MSEDNTPQTAPPLQTVRRSWQGRELALFIMLLVLGALLSYIDNRLKAHTLLVEMVHMLTVISILVLCLVCQRRYPEITQFGWTWIIWGLVCLTIGSIVDFFDDPPTINLLNIMGVPFGRSWQQAFLKKILGYTVGTGLMAYGFYQWVPWMIQTRLNVENLNKRLSTSNIKLNRVLVSLDEHVESERLNISRELHDDVAQQLTFLSFQVQMCQRELDKTPDKAAERIKSIGLEVSEVLRSVRQISRDLRPESLYALGLIPALEQFLEKARQQMPDTEFSLNVEFLTGDSGEEQHARIESCLDERALLNLFRILQEATRNAMKHSQAKHIQISIVETPNQFKFAITDNGVGLPWKVMPSDEALVQDGHLGVVGLKERVKEIDGTIDLRNNPDKGATMEMTLSK